MQSTVNLNSPFSYSFTLLIILGVLLVLAIIGYVYKEQIEALINKNALAVIKRKYLKKLDNLLNRVTNSQIDNRRAYQELSNIGRNFIKAATKIDVLTISLKEAKKLDIDGLVELMEECYPPEFAKQSRGNVMSSISNTRMVIEKWN